MVPAVRRAIPVGPRGGRFSSARIAASSSGSAWSQPQTCRAPWVTSRRSSSAADQRTSPVWPPRPSAACSTARSTETTMSPRCGRGRGGRGHVRDLGRRGAKASGGRSGNDSTSVGPRLAHVCLRSARPARRRRTGSARSRPAMARRRVERRRDRPRQRRDRDRRATPSRTVRSIRHGPTVDRPGHDAEPRPSAAAAARRDSSSTTVFCG